MRPFLCMTEPLGGVSAPREPLPDDVSNGDDDTSIRDSFGMTVKGIAGTTASSICMPRVPPYCRDLPLPLLDAQPDDAALARAMCVVGLSLFVTGCALGGLGSGLGLFNIILCPVCLNPRRFFLVVSDSPLVLVSSTFSTFDAFLLASTSCSLISNSLKSNVMVRSFVLLGTVSSKVSSL